MIRSLPILSLFFTLLLLFSSFILISSQFLKPQSSPLSSPLITILSTPITSPTPSPTPTRSTTIPTPTSADVEHACSICQKDKFCCYSTETGLIRGVTCCIDPSGNSCLARTGECTDSSSARVAGIVALVLFGLVAVLVLTLIVCIFIPAHRRRRNEINAHPQYHLNRHCCCYYVIHPRHMQKQQINPAPEQAAAVAVVIPPVSPVAEEVAAAPAV